jgi:autotransporter-associated beta strand protein
MNILMNSVCRSLAFLKNRMRATSDHSGARTRLLHFSPLVLLAITGSVQGETTINVGNEIDLNSAIQTINAHPTDSYKLNFTSGFSLNQPLPAFATQSTVTLSGNSKTIDGANLYQPLVINGGIVAVQGLSVINAGQPIQVTGGILVDSTGSLHGPITDNGNVRFLNADPFLFSGDISGTGSVNILGTGAVTFTGTNTYQGGTMVGPGSTLIGTTSSMPSTILDLGTVHFHQSTAGTYSGVIIGAGGVKISGAGPITLTGANTYSGGTVIDTGSKLIGTTSSLQGPITNLGTVQFNQSTNGTYAGNLNGNGSVQISGTGVVTFSGTNSYSGGTTVDAGSTLVGTTNSLQGAITNSGSVQFNQNSSGIYAGVLSGSGHLGITGGGAVLLTGLNTYSGGTTIGSGSSLSGNSKSLQGSFVNNGSMRFTSGGTDPFSGQISGTGSVEITENAAVKFSNTNSYTGGTIVDTGATLTGTTLSLQGAVQNNGLVVLNSTPNGSVPAPSLSNPLKSVVTPNVFTGNISGTGKLEIGGGGITALVGTNSYSGGTTVDTGSALVGSTSSLKGNIVNNGFLQFTNGYTNGGSSVSQDVAEPVVVNSQPAMGIYSGNISGSGTVEISGGVPLLFTGINSYTGGTYIDATATLIGSTGSVQGNIVNEGTLFFSQLSAGTFGGNISGAGGVTINGGPVTFSGINSYTGGTNVNGDSSLVGTTSSLQGSIFNSGLVHFNQSTAGTYAGVISGSGGVEISGMGITTFSGANTYTGGTTIDNGGTLNVAGSVLGLVDVNNGGTLKGTGVVGATAIHAGGTIAPGTIGSPLKIDGNLTQGAGSTFTAQVDSTGSDKISVNGSAVINGATKLNVEVGSGVLTVGKKYELLSATGGLTGQYASVFTSPLDQHVVFTEQYGANNLMLVVNSNLSNYVQTSNQMAVASVLDQASSTATGGFATAITQLTTLGPGELPSAMNQLTGDIYGSISTIERQTTTVQLQLISNRLASLLAPSSSQQTLAKRMNEVRLVSRQASDDQPSNAVTGGLPTPQTWTTWAQGYGLGGTVAGDSNAGGVNYRLGGTLFGTERWLGDKVMVGVLGGYAGTSIGNRQDGSNAQVDAYQVGLYQLFRHDLLYVSNIDAYGNSSYNTSRPMTFGTIQQTASGSSTANQWAHYTEAGLTMEVDEFRFQPFIGVQYMYLDQAGFTESGAGSLDMTTSQQIINSVRNSFGGRVYCETTWGNVVVIPALSARYQHEWGNGTQLVSSAFSGAPTSQFVISGNHTGRDFGLFTLSTMAYLTPRLNLFGAIDTQVATGYSAVIGSGGLQYSW